MEKRKFNVTTDSSSDASKEKLTAIDVDFISYAFTSGENKYVDEMSDEQNLWYLNKMREGTIFKTSQINQFQYEEFFTKIAEKGLPIVHVSLCGGLSESLTNARAAAQELSKKGIRVEVIDATVGSLASLMIAREACALRDKGEEIDNVLSHLNDFASRIHTYYVTDDLTYFARGGRLSKGAALISKVLHINVILTTDKVGHLIVAHKVRGRKNAFKTIVDLVKKEVINSDDQILYVLHGDSLDEAKQLVGEVNKVANFKEAEYFLMGPTIGAHAGPGLLSLFYLGKPKE